MAPEIRKKGWAILSVCVGGEGVPKKYFKSRVFGSVFRYLKVGDFYITISLYVRLLLDYDYIIMRLLLDYL